MLWVAAFVVVTASPPRPAVGDKALAIAQVGQPALALHPAGADGWRSRALVSRLDGRVVVAGPTRPQPALPTTTPAIAASTALATVDEAGFGRADHATLVITRHGRLAWRIDPPVQASPNSGGVKLRNVVLLVDAASGAIGVRHDRMRSEQIGAFVENPTTTPRAQTFDLLDYDPDAADGDLRGERVAVFNCVQPQGGSICGYATIGPSNAAGDFLHPAPRVDNAADNIALEDAFAVQSVHHHAELFLAYLDELGAPQLRCIAEGMPVVLVANYKAYVDGEPVLIANAGYSGDCSLTASFGQGPNADYGYDSDVVYHELTHGMVETMMDGGFLGLAHPREEAVLSDAGAINEGVADFVASVITDDPNHAEYVAALGDGSGRTLANDLQCPASITGEVHADGELWGGALWDAYLEVGAAFVPAVLDSIALLPEDATFEEAAAALVDVTEAEVGADAAQAVTDALENRGLVDCPRIMPWDELGRALWLRPRGQQGSYDPIRPPPAQLAVDLPVDAAGFRLRFDVEVRPTIGFTDTTEIHAVFGFGAPLSFSYGEDDQGRVTVDADPDLHLSAIDEQAAGDGVVVEAAGGQTIYIALFNQSPNVSLVSNVEVMLLAGDSDGGDTGAAGTGSDNGSETGNPGQTDSDSGAELDAEADGCACRTRTDTRHGWAWTWVLLGAVRRRHPSRQRGAERNEATVATSSAPQATK